LELSAPLAGASEDAMTPWKPWALPKPFGLKRLLKDRRGSITPVFAMMAIPMTVVAGFSIDLSRAYMGHAKLQQAVDATALALAHEPAGTALSTLNTQAQTWINADLHDTDLALPAMVNVTLSNGQLVLDAQTHEPAILSSLAGINQFNMDATATTKWGLNHVEVALVLDNTGSMSQNNKLPTLTASAQSLVQTLMAQAGGDANAVKISIVPFSMTVNVGQQYQSASWITGVMPAAYGSDIFSTANTNRFTLFTQLNKAWGGCVEGRPMPYDVQDTAPSAGTPATMFVPYFAPDEPDTPSSGSTAFYNNYLSDGLSGNPTWQQRQGNVAKYHGAVKSGSNGSTGYAYGPNAGCALEPLLRLTNSQSALNSELGGLVAIGDTNLDIGLQWGWLTLSPTGPFADGVAYNTPNTTKIIVFLTDGWNEDTVNNDANTSFYSGIGYIWQNRIGVTSGSTQAQRNTALDNRTALICSNIKADGIVVYTVRIDVSGVAPTVLQNCATSPSDFYDVPNVANLPTAFQQIAGQIGKLRIAQ
jgi:Flp pilus assembly protein TadG